MSMFSSLQQLVRRSSPVWKGRRGNRVGLVQHILPTVSFGKEKPRPTHPPGFRMLRDLEWESHTDSIALSFQLMIPRVPLEVGLRRQTRDGSLHRYIYAGARLVSQPPIAPSINPARRDNCTSLYHETDLPASSAANRSHSPTMCFVPGTSHSLAMTTTPHHAGCKRPRAEPMTTTTTLALYDPSVADRRRANEQAIAQASAGALVPFVRSRQPINAIPLSAVAPRKLAVPNAVRAEPPWLRRGLLLHLKLRFDLPVHFIDEKVVTVTDLDRHQNRFRLPSEGVIRNLRPVLSPMERMAANLLHEEAPRPPRLPKIPGEKAKKRKGKKHGGLPVLVIEPCSGIRELQLSRWDSSGGTVIKGEGYLEFINNCGFKVDDIVEIWAFKETYFRLFGEDLCHDSPLYLLITKKGQMLPRH